MTWNPVPATLEKRFTLIAPFAHGSTGSTYLADEPETGRRGLLKIMAPAKASQAAERQRMRRELLKQATMSSPHLSLPYATGESAEGGLWLFRESIEGTALSALLSSNGALPRQEAFLIASQLASALDDLHRAGLLHRDVKPGHVIVGRDADGVPWAHLIDAGVCRPLDGAGTTTVFGTPGYVAPEQLSGKLVSFRSDLYAVGCVIFEMLCGSPAFAGEDDYEKLAAQQAGELTAFPVGQSPQLNALLSSLLASDPQDRPFSAQKLRRALDPFLPSGATLNKHPTASLAKPPAPKTGSRIPPPPPQGEPRPATRTSRPPLPGSKQPDRTQALQADQIVEMVAAPPKPQSVMPPPLRQDGKSARVRQFTAPYDSLSTGPSPPQAEAQGEEPRPSADHTQPIRLSQILAVANQRIKSTPVPPAFPRASSAQAARDSRPAQATPEAAPDVDLPIPDEVPDTPFGKHARSLASNPNLSAAAPLAASGQSDLSRAATRHIADKQNGEDDADDEATVQLDRLEPDKRERQATLQGIPYVKLPVPDPTTLPLGDEAPPVVAANTPRHMEFNLGADSSELTLPHDPALARAAAERIGHAQQAREEGRSQQEDDTDGEHRLPMGNGSPRKTGMAIAALTLLGVLGFGISSLFGGTDEDDLVAKQAGPEVKSAQGATSALPATKEPGRPTAKGPAHAEQPLAAAPKAQPMPVVLSIPAPEEHAEPRKPAAQAKPEVERKPAAHPTNEDGETGRHDRRAHRREAAANKDALWAKARDEARGHFAAKRYKQAGHAYEVATRHKPSHAGTFAGLGGARLQGGDTRGAIQAYLRAVQLSPSTSGFHAALGRAYITAGDKSKARSAYKRALALDPKNEAAKAALSSL